LNLGLFLVVVPLIIMYVPGRWVLAVAAAVGYLANFWVVSRSQELKKAEPSADAG
jgi:peptidoglycan/LPS O-acetylase OafA/YrhL